MLNLILRLIMMRRREFVKSCVLSIIGIPIMSATSVPSSSHNSDECLRFLTSNSEFAWYAGKIHVSPSIDYKEVVKNYKYTL